jgi:hypothetical protein
MAFLAWSILSLTETVATSLPMPLANAAQASWTLDTTFWIASCTKLVTTIAAMQLVESGKVRLDSEEDIQLILPELSRISVLEEGADGALKLVDQQRKITLRMLLTHTGEGCPIPFLSSIDASTSHSSASCQNLGYFLAKLTLCAHRSRVRIQLL